MTWPRWNGKLVVELGLEWSLLTPGLFFIDEHSTNASHAHLHLLIYL